MSAVTKSLDNETILFGDKVGSGSLPSLAARCLEGCGAFAPRGRLYTGSAQQHCRLRVQPCHLKGSLLRLVLQTVLTKLQGGGVKATDRLMFLLYDAPVTLFGCANCLKQHACFVQLLT